MCIEVLKKAKELKNDEFYTLKDDIEKIFNNFAPLLKHYDFTRVELPFDDDESEFTKYCKDNNLNYHNTHGDYRNHNYVKNGVVISNPPFSLLREIINFYMKHNIKFILLAPLHSFVYKDFINYFNECKLFYYYLRINWFKTPTGELKAVCCFIMSNIENDGYLIENRYWSPKRDKALYDENGVMIKSGKLDESDLWKYLSITYVFESNINQLVQQTKQYKLELIKRLYNPNQNKQYFTRIKLVKRDNK